MPLSSSASSSFTPSTRTLSDEATRSAKREKKNNNKRGRTEKRVVLLGSLILSFAFLQFNQHKSLSWSLYGSDKEVIYGSSSLSMEGNQSSLTEAFNSSFSTFSAPPLEQQQQHHSFSSSNLYYGVETAFLHQVVQNRNFSDPTQALATLQAILQHDEENPYHYHHGNGNENDNDFLVFEHTLKSGGTSLSMVLEQMGGVVPGSAASANFQMNQYYDYYYQHQGVNNSMAIANKRQTPGDHNTETMTTTSRPDRTYLAESWQNYRVLYSHSMINQHDNKNKNRVARRQSSSVGNGRNSSKPSDHELFVVRALAAAAAVTTMANSTTSTSTTTDGADDLNPQPLRPRRIRVLAMIRDPMSYAASNIHEWMCQVKKRIGVAGQLRNEMTMMQKKNSNSTKNNATDINSNIGNINVSNNDNSNEKNDNADNDACGGFTSLDEIYTIWTEHVLRPVCFQQNQRYAKFVDVPNMCPPLVLRGQLPMPHCQSVRHAMDSRVFDNGVHDEHKRYIPRDVYNYYNYEHYNKNNNKEYENVNKENVNGPQQSQQQRILADIEFHALRRLGGLTAQATAHMMWHGITERMPESMCLFHFMTDFPYVETPHSRFKQCRPLTFWNDSDKASFREREALGYAVSKAAHAILDVRMARMCRTLRLYDGNDTDDDSGGGGDNSHNDATRTNTTNSSVPLLLLQSSSRKSSSDSGRGYRNLGLPESCCANFVFDELGRLIRHVPSQIY
eukprot:CAMPEP_0117014394 /NCGR_PEP_ID=MMETSP0472-20121206/11684_1 /TAXON_ID=693140 ORGANISM="Tiarina fusus, Strain LIS" /NCGR_SAMPLE_ID=MMETSP0472 /ASSEMBLY_ACC=CAM_ASM_000603 /LENGTH=731 /DNA_ID=CAMNT_0004717939 /DNA_START=213 /DNA_END=2408 /DNA_ORIENTATION=-